ncbi:conjugal transfer protein TraG N-terminal domain-containing protein [Phenylobacterium sp.]|uniref:conjugal transfer protein TraG N-terminal domain-containing protein n=1 Tax=Phenylobacterium sp. TaxID=1871053 RepID=UPI002811B90F|nr:conjugal transfer protein TraG N-terminal domain-containing protein [Phenylobacterium sp.]
MDPVEVITYGGGAYYRDVFQAVALLSGSDGISSLLRLALVLGLMMGILKAVFDFNVGKILKWFLIAFITYGILWVPKVQVHVTDVFDPALTGADVANVPLGVGMTASLTSRVGHRVIQLTETAFGDPQDNRYSKTGMIYGAKVFERLRTAQIADPRFDGNLRSFIRGCVYYDILDGHYSAGELARQNDLWTYVTVTKGTNPGRSIEYTNPTNVREIINCPTAAARMNAEWAATIQSSMRLFERRSRPDLPEAELQTALMSEMGTLHPIMIGASRDATSAFQQVLMANAVRRGVTGFSAEAGGESMGALAETQAEIQTRNTQALLGGVAEKAIVILRIVVDLLFIGMFPILFPAFLLPGLGPRMIQGYLTGFLYLQLWGPMYVIVHKISMGAAASKTAAAAYIPDTSAGIKIANLEAIGSVNADIAAVAGVMTMMIPVMAGLLTKGAMAVGSQGEALLSQFRSGAEAAGSMSTTGNLSYGNTAFENHSFNNLAGNRQHTSFDVDQGNYRFVDQNLNRVEIGAGGAMTLQSSMSQTAANLRMSEGVSAAAVEAAGRRREESQALRQSYTEGWQRTQAEGVEAVNSWLEARVNNRTIGSEQRETHGSLYQTMDQVADTLQRTHGYDRRTAAETAARATLETYAEGKAGLDFLGTGGGVGARGSLAASMSLTNTATETEGLNAARQMLSSQGFSDRVDRTAATYAAESFSQTSTAQNMSAEKISDTFSSTSSLLNAAETAESQARTYEQRADYVRSNSATFDTNLNNVFVPFAMERLVGTRDSYGVVIDEDRAREILAGRTPEDLSRLEEVGRAFQAQQAERIPVPDLITENRDVGQNVQQFQPNQVQVLDVPSSGSELRGGFGLSELGRPGEAISEHAAGSPAWQAEREEAAAAAAARAGDGGAGSPNGSGAARDRADDSGNAAAGGRARAGEEAGAPASRPPAVNDDEPVVRPQFNSPLREQIRAATDRVDAEVDGWRGGRVAADLADAGEGSQTQAGAARVARRNE